MNPDTTSNVYLIEYLARLFDNVSLCGMLLPPGLTCDIANRFWVPQNYEIV